MKENYILHKLHSLTGIIPVGFYLAQHLTLNTFTLAGEDKYNSVIGFFEGMPKHILLFLKFGLIWAPLIFHAVYGMFIVARADSNYSQSAYKFRENRYYAWQRISGIVAFLFLCYHMMSTSVAGMIYGVEKTILYENWANHLQYGFFGIPFAMFAIYVIGVVSSAYHLSYGLWNFAIRWGITISERSQATMGKVATGAFVLLSVMGTLALVGFFNPILEKKETSIETVQRQIPLQVPVKG